MGLKVITTSATEPILLDEAAENLRVSAVTGDSPESYPEAARIRRLITAARMACEQQLEMSLVTKTLELAVDGFPGDSIELTQGPVRSITSIKYTDEDGLEQTLDASSYYFDDYQSSSWAILAIDTDWPDTQAIANSVRIRYVAGYPSSDSPAEEVPEPIRQAMHLLIGHYFTNREAVDADALRELPLGVAALLTPYRKGMGV